MRTFLLLLTIGLGLSTAQELRFENDSKVPGKTLFRTSITALAVANALDIHSSWGKHELNPALSGPKGTFGRDGALLKIGLQGSLMGLEYLITRRRMGHRWYRALSVINFGAAGVIGATVVHNYGVARPPR